MLPPASKRTRPCATFCEQHRIRRRTAGPAPDRGASAAPPMTTTLTAPSGCVAARGRSQRRGAASNSNASEAPHAAALAAMQRFSKRLDISAQLFYWSKAVGRVRERVKVAERDGIWSRGGVPVEELPDPFAPAAAAGLLRSDRSPSSPRRASAAAGRSGLYSISGADPADLVWLVITAPLSRALEPLDDPALLLLSATTASRSPGAARSRKRRSTSTRLNPLTPGGLRRDRGPPLLPPLGHRPARHRPGDGRRPARRRRARRAAARSPSSSPRPASCPATAPSSARRRR